MNTKLYLGLLVCTLLLLAACSDSDTESAPSIENPTAEFDEQTVSWEACDPNLFPEVLSGPLADLGERLECATLTAPLAWSEPERDTINLGILRVKAANEAERQGAILINPGGPGGDGLVFGALFGLIFENGNVPDTRFVSAAPELLGQVSDQYDVIGFSPRGVGGSFQLFCGSNKLFPETEFYTDRSEENLAALVESGRLVAEACKNNPLSDYINTEQTVQDMDLIRRLLGDEKLNFLGFSYGSWLGSWYAKRFPEHAGNIVLDANTEFSATFQESFSLQPLGFQRAFQEVAVPYIARNSGVFALGESPEEVYSVYDTLPPLLKDALLNGSLSLVSNLYSSGAVAFIGQSLVAAQGVAEVLGSSEPLTPETYAAFLEQVATYTYSDDEEFNNSVSELGVILAADYLTFLDAPPGEVVLPPNNAVFISVVCNDTPWTQDPDYFVEFGNEQNEANPLIGGAFTSEPCAFWGEPSAEKPDTPDDLSPVLMVQTGFDAATPAEGAVRAFESLPGAKLVYIENEMSHAAFPYNTVCVDAKVATYLLDGTLPEEDVSNCDALPLPGEEQVYPPGGVPSLGSLSAQAAEVAGSNALYDLVHELVRENAADFFGHSSDR